MKKLISILSVVLVLAACDKTGLQTNKHVETPDDIYGAIAGQNNATKAYFAGPVITGTGSAQKVEYPHFWQVGDDISVFWGTGSNVLFRAVNNVSNDNTSSSISYTRFEKMAAVTDATYASVTLDGRYTIYPYDYRNKVDADGTVHFRVPATQTYREVAHPGNTGAPAVPAGTYVSYGSADFNYTSSSTYSTGCAVFIAKNTEVVDEANHYNYFNFFNVGCWLKLQIKSDEEFTLGKIEMKANETSLTLAGPAHTSFTDYDTGTGSFAGVKYYKLTSSSVITKETGGIATITLNGNGTKKVNSTLSDFYLYFLPTNFFGTGVTNKGFTVKIYDSSNVLRGTATAKPSSETDAVSDGDYFQRNRVVLMSEWDVTDIKFAVLEVKAWDEVEYELSFE